MAYPESSAPAAPAARPGTVTAAMYLLYLGAVIALLGAILGLATISDSRAALEEAYRGTQAEGQEGTAVAFGVIGPAVFSLVIGALLVLLAVFNGKGKQWARITTWVVGGIYLCCVGIGLGLQNVNMGGDGNQGPTTDAINDAMENHLPGWYLSLAVPSSIVSILAILATIVLLALPASSAFFRKPPAEPVWTPPTT
jgi:hypothetical protein